MVLHIPTLLIVSIFVFFLMGLHAWYRETREPSLAYLSGMMLLGALGVGWSAGVTGVSRSGVTRPLPSLI